jgi:hypothetical protein
VTKFTRSCPLSKPISPADRAAPRVHHSSTSDQVHKILPIIETHFAGRPRSTARPPLRIARPPRVDHDHWLTSSVHHWPAPPATPGPRGAFNGPAHHPRARPAASSRARVDWLGPAHRGWLLVTAVDKERGRGRGKGRGKGRGRGPRPRGRSSCRLAVFDGVRDKAARARGHPGWRYLMARSRGGKGGGIRRLTA